MINVSLSLTLHRLFPAAPKQRGNQTRRTAAIETRGTPGADCTLHIRAWKFVSSSPWLTPPRLTFANDGAEPATALSLLSPREVPVLRLIGKGLSRTQIAHELSRSAKTIDGHQERMMKKLGITSRADLMRFAIREGFTEA